MKIKLPTFSSLIPCLNQVRGTYGRLQSAIFIIFFSFTRGLFFPWDFRVQPLSVSCGVSECSLYTVPISDATEGLGEYSYPMWHAYTKPTRSTSILVCVKYKKPTRVQKKLALGAAKGKRRAGSGLNFEAHKTRGTLPWRSLLVPVIQSGHALALVVLCTKQKPAPWRWKGYTHTWHCFPSAGATLFRETEMTHIESEGDQHRTLLWLSYVISSRDCSVCSCLMQ